ncbi:LysR family transcriptional regulator [Rhodophyticola porphyridii]|uniref:LysR family transcriptional regulator n=1 Tax=Rhodophyticola porphyridii TaxID=1852017 RepID=A0A3L9Y1B6_9RHOB|nr:LysR family transcriptional regulator [Rhodophyticola porphyridii]RMA42242.1 LysR family transcriptional regulator [Rhodophyticola porphyridii]
MHDRFLNYFDETARQGSIRKAAAVLNMSSSSLNRKIISTENKLGIRLFDRHADGVALTEAGVVVLEHCRNTLFDYQRIINMVEDIRDMRTGHINIATLDSVALSVLPEVLDTFRASYPEVGYTIQTAEPHDVMQAVADGTADIGLSFSNDLHPDVRCQAEKSTPIGAIMAHDHPLAERDLLEFDDLVPYPMIRSYDSQSHRSFVNEAVGGMGAQISTQLSTNSLPLAKAMILKGGGVGIYSKIGFVDEIEDGRLRYVGINSPLLRELRMGLLISARTGLLPVQHLLARALSKSLRSLRLDS